MSGERMREIRERHSREGAATEVRYLYAWEQAHLDRAWLLARVEELEAALRPFARVIGHRGGQQAGPRAPTMADYDAARLALSDSAEPTDG